MLSKDKRYGWKINETAHTSFIITFLGTKWDIRRGREAWHEFMQAAGICKL